MVGDENNRAELLKRRGLDGSVRDEVGVISEEAAEDITVEG